MREQSWNMNFIKKTSFWRIILFIVLVITTIPLLVIAPYNHSSGDDYSYGYRVHDAIKQDGNAFDVIKAIGETVKVTYHDWQGTYSAIVLFSVQPAVWGEQYYWISTYILVPCLLLGIFAIFRSWIGVVYGRKDIADIVACGVSILFLQTLPSPVEGLYWWNGASYYIIWSALMMVLVSQMIIMLHNRRCSVKKCIALALMGAILGGGNLITALLTLEISVLFLGFAIVKRNCPKQVFVVFACVAIGFLVNVAAPGNANRQDAYLQISPILAVVKSFYAAAYWALRWTTPYVIVFWLLFLPFAIVLQRAVREDRSRFSWWFKLILVICLFASTFTPNIFAGTSINIGRIQNIRYLFWIFSGIAAESIIVRQVIFVATRKHPDFRVEMLTAWFTNKRTLLLLCAAMLIIGVSSAFNIRGNGCDAFSSLSATSDLLTGKAKAYDRIADERSEQLLSSEKNVVLQPFTQRPYVLYKGDITTDPTNWRNTAVARFFGKDSVVLGQETPSIS